uniref:Putative deoxyribonuclease ii n=1 Tax=Panstrongylus lignarius TaxID=156445 RepID=A0A224XVG7_9HEMI
MNYVNLFTFFCVIIWNINIIRSALQCVDESGKPVDWYVLYKLPEIAHESSLVSNGSAYLYITSETLQDGWIQSDQPIYSEHSLVARTLKNLYETQNEEIWVVYNDQGPLIKGLLYGHTKGVIGADENNGFWLIHSVPHFPSLNHEYSYPQSGHKNGQSMLCISFLKDQIDTLGQILMYYKPLILEKKISAKLSSEYPQLVAAAKGARVRKAPWQLSSTLTSAKGRKFTNFAKAKKI